MFTLPEGLSFSIIFSELCQLAVPLLEVSFLISCGVTLIFLVRSQGGK